MGAFNRLVRFGAGGALGAAIGGVIAYLYAPQSGDELTGKVRTRLDDARVAGATAKEAKEQEFIARYRAVVNDPDALSGEVGPGLS